MEAAFSGRLLLLRGPLGRTQGTVQDLPQLRKSNGNNQNSG